MKKKYDVFISYRRKNADGNDEGTHIARTIKLSLDLLMQNTDSCCFFDYSNMSNEDFPTRILNTIASAKVFVCVLTKNAMQRCGNEEDWVRREILQAKRCGLKIIFINPDGQFTGDYPSKFPKELDFVRTTNHLTVHTDSSFDRDIQAIYDEEIYPVIMPTLQPTPQPEPRPSKNYKIGDYYDDGKKKGVVFEVTADGQHGKIVSLTKTRRFWAKFGLFDFISAVFRPEQHAVELVGADDKYNGAINMAKVQQIEDWRKKYPAFALCADLGEGWYLPAIEELKEIALNDAIREAVNCILESEGEELIDEYDDYWSSTEYSDSHVWDVGMFLGETSTSHKYRHIYVRAVSAF